MSSGMNRSQAEEYAKTMTYRQAISNIRTGKGIVYRKATMIKLHELAEIADKLVLCKDCIHWTEEKDEEDDILYGWCRAPFENDNLLVYGDDATRIFTAYDFFCKSGERREP